MQFMPDFFFQCYLNKVFFECYTSDDLILQRLDGHRRNLFDHLHSLDRGLLNVDG